MHQEMKRDLAKLFAKMFIARPEIRAAQLASGEYRPMRPPFVPNQLGFDMDSLVDHISGAQSYGHYMVNADNKVKLFAFDIDLEKTGELPGMQTDDGVWEFFAPGNPREYWMSRKQGPGRNMIKCQLRCMANDLARVIQDELEIPVAVAYSGSKGIHVYGFTGLTTAELARQGASIVLQAVGTWKLKRGNNIYAYEPKPDLGEHADPFSRYQQYSLEIYPKQDSTTHLPEHLGNLMRLPCGVNLKSPKDGAFFLDLRAPLSELAPMDPIEALTTADPWR